MQYGTVAKLKVKPGKLGDLQKLNQSEAMSNIPGLVSTTVYQMDRDANELLMCVVFESKEAYVKNADSPEQDARYREFVALLDAEPEWNDGTVIHPEA